ncbi:DUF4157 domain-containing protein [Algoriphagus halophilus]|uniref:eCIS core domain-containing protein n=1 Tax=Algoriphagus halophilus TaxID=226505 RepID=UPI00358E6CD0
MRSFVNRKDKKQLNLGKPRFFQTKLKVNNPGDKFEQEADSIAKKVTQSEQSDLFFKPQFSQISSSGSYPSNIQVPDSLESQLTTNQQSGNTLPKEVQSSMESKLGYDFSKVKIHQGSEADEASKSIHAKAFTYGTDIYFNSSNYNPNTTEGKELIAHELTHVVQQSASPMGEIQRDEEETISPDPEEEEESEFEFDFDVLPPAIQMSLGQWMLEANTSRVALQFTQGLLRTRLGYDYGGNISLGTRTPSWSTQLGFNPHSPALSFGYSRDQFRFGANADLTTGGFGLNLGYGARLLPMPFDLAGPINSGWAGASGILGDLGNMDDPLSFYQAHGDNIDDIMAAVKALQPLADEENQRFGAGIRFRYNPQSGLLIHAGVQWMF